MSESTDAPLYALMAQWRETSAKLLEKAERLDRLREPERAVKLQTRGDELDSCAHQLSAALAARQGPDWQPIATAPKTSRHILVWTPANQCTNLVVWREYDKPSCWVHAFGGNELCDEPTHWRQLADPPGPRPEREMRAGGVSPDLKDESNG